MCVCACLCKYYMCVYTVYIHHVWVKRIGPTYLQVGAPAGGAERLHHTGEAVCLLVCWCVCFVVVRIRVFAWERETEEQRISLSSVSIYIPVGAVQARLVVDGGVARGGGGHARKQLQQLGGGLLGLLWVVCFDGWGGGRGSINNNKWDCVVLLIYFFGGRG